jgi:hypothetical protein
MHVVDVDVVAAVAATVSSLLCSLFSTIQISSAAIINSQHELRITMEAAKKQYKLTRLEELLTDDFEKSLANVMFYQDEVYYGKGMAEKLYPMGKDGRRTMAKDYMKM